MKRTKWTRSQQSAMLACAHQAHKLASPPSAQSVHVHKRTTRVLQVYKRASPSNVQNVRVNITCAKCAHTH